MTNKINTSMTKVQIITDAYSNLKDIINAAQNDDPYTAKDHQWTQDLLKCVNNLRKYVPKEELVRMGEDGD